MAVNPKVSKHREGQDCHCVLVKRRQPNVIESSQERHVRNPLGHMPKFLFKTTRARDEQVCAIVLGKTSIRICTPFSFSRRPTYKKYGFACGLSKSSEPWA